MSRMALGLNQYLVQWVSGVLSLDIKHPEHETDQLHSSTVTGDKELYLHSPMHFKGVILIYRDNSAFAINTYQK
jgi:hypothetical protein